MGCGETFCSSKTQWLLPVGLSACSGGCTSLLQGVGLEVFAQSGARVVHPCRVRTGRSQPQDTALQGNA